MWKFFASFMLIGVVAGRVSRPYDTARLRESVERQCELYGGEEHVEEVMKDMETFVDCIVNVTDMEAAAHLRGSRSSEFPVELVSFVKTHCKKQKQINTCFMNALDGITPCTEPRMRNKMDVAKESVVELTDLFCKDDSKSFSEFINDGALSCMEDQLYPIIACTNDIQSLQNYRTITNAEACDKISSLFSCITRALEQCPKPSTANFVRSFFKTSFNGSLCIALADQSVNATGNNVRLTVEQKVNSK